MEDTNSLFLTIDDICDIIRENENRNERIIIDFTLIDFTEIDFTEIDFTEIDNFSGHQPKAKLVINKDSWDLSFVSNYNDNPSHVCILIKKDSGSNYLKIMNIFVHGKDKCKEFMTDNNGNIITSGWANWIIILSKIIVKKLNLMGIILDDKASIGTYLGTRISPSMRKESQIFYNSYYHKWDLYQELEDFSKYYNSKSVLGEMKDSYINEDIQKIYKKFQNNEDIVKLIWINDDEFQNKISSSYHNYQQHAGRRKGSRRPRRSKRRSSGKKRRRRKGSCANKRKSRSCRRSKRCTWAKGRKGSRGHRRRSKRRK